MAPRNDADIPATDEIALAVTRSEPVDSPGKRRSLGSQDEARRRQQEQDADERARLRMRDDSRQCGERQQRANERHDDEHLAP